MRKTVFNRGTLLLFTLLAAALAALSGQQQKPPLASTSDQLKNALQGPHLDSVSQEFWPMANEVVVRGSHLPAKFSSGSNPYSRLIRLVTVGGSGDPASSTFYIGQTGNWTATKIDDVCGFAVPGGRKYKIGIVEQQPGGAKLLSNELELFIFMNLDHVTPSPVPHAGMEIEVWTGNDLGPQGAKIVRYANQAAQVTEWGASGKFKIRLPTKILPGTHDLFVEDNGTVVSKKLSVQLLSVK